MPVGVTLQTLINQGSAIPRRAPLVSRPDVTNNLVMKSVSVARLKSNLSQYLSAVKKGAEIIVTSHRHPIARLAPLAEDKPAIEIIAARRPVSALKKIKGIKLKTIRSTICWRTGVADERLS